MRNTRFYLLTSSLLMCSAFGFANDAFASNEVRVVMPPPEQHYQMSVRSNCPHINYRKPTADEVLQTKIQAKKSSILQKLAQIKKESNGSNGCSSNGNTVLGNTPRVLYTYSRLLDYSPHPRKESILKDKPVLYKGKNYYFDVTYQEDWKESSKGGASLSSLCFTVDVYENGVKVRNLTTPKLNISPKKIKKDQVIGIAEVAPFKINIKVDEILTKSNGVSELTFKLDLIG